MMGNSRSYDIRLLDGDGQLLLVIPMVGDSDQAVSMKAGQMLSKHGAAAYEIRKLPHVSAKPNIGA
jgi:hypothetical protein